MSPRKQRRAILNTPEGRHYSAEFERFLDAALSDVELLVEFAERDRDKFTEFCVEKYEER